VRHDTIPAADPGLAGALRDQGYCIVREALPSSIVRALDRDLSPVFEATPFCEGGFYGERTKRFGRLLARAHGTERFVRHSAIFAAAQEMLAPSCDTIQLNLTQAIALHPGALPQAPHRDQDMWRGHIGEVEYLVNVMWPFTDYRADNGATLLWPGSHGPNALADQPSGPPVVAEMDPGDALIFLGSTLHGAGSNCSARVRRGMIISYCLGWLKPYENQWLAYPPVIARGFSRELAQLVGYQQHRPNLGNYEGRCPSILLGDDVPDYLAAIDALRPDQAAMIADYLAEQRRAS